MIETKAKRDHEKKGKLVKSPSHSAESGRTFVISMRMVLRCSFE